MLVALANFLEHAYRDLLWNLNIKKELEYFKTNIALNKNLLKCVLVRNRRCPSICKNQENSGVIRKYIKFGLFCVDSFIYIF